MLTSLTMFSICPLVLYLVIGLILNTFSLEQDTFYVASILIISKNWQNLLVLLSLEVVVSFDGSNTKMRTF